METTECLFGHQGHSTLAFLGKDRLNQSQITFYIVRCSECGLIFLSPRPTLAEIARYYPYSEYRCEFSPAIEDEPSRLRRFNRRYSLNKPCRFIEGVKLGGQLLDVGCGTGNFLAQMRERGGWKVYGLDISSEAVEYARRRFDLDVFHGALEDAGYPSAFFDVVTLWNVLEHLHDPRATLKEVRRVLRADGILALSVPNGDSLDARLFGRYWIGLDPPRHLYTFTRQTLQRLLVQTGFKVLEVRHITGSYHSLVSSTELCIQASGLSPGVKGFLSRLPPSWPVHILVIPYLRVTEWVGRGAIFSVLAKAA